MTTDPTDVDVGFRRGDDAVTLPGTVSSVLNPLDVDGLREAFNGSQPFRHIVIDDLVPRDLALQIARSLPSYEQAREQGREFYALNELRKVQLVDQDTFPDPVKTLNEALASPQWLEQLVAITGIPNLVADPELRGGGIHLTGQGGRLDVHVDFNYVEDRKLHRRLNILVYFNERWEDDWGGEVELWDPKVERCGLSLSPRLNRCLIFETNEISFHGVTPVTCPPGFARQSFAAYYYTKEPPPHWDHQSHSTVFRARPSERFRGSVLMPLNRLSRGAAGRALKLVRDLKRRVLG